MGESSDAPAPAPSGGGVKMSMTMSKPKKAAVPQPTAAGFASASELREAGPREEAVDELVEGSIGKDNEPMVIPRQNDTFQLGGAQHLRLTAQQPDGDGEADASAAVSPSREEEKPGAGEMERGHLADVLGAAFSTKVAMKDFVSAVKAKNGEAFRTVQLSSKGVGSFSNEQIAARIAACRPGQASTAGGLLQWLTVSGVPCLWGPHVNAGGSLSRQTQGQPHVGLPVVTGTRCRIQSCYPRRI